MNRKMRFIERCRSSKETIVFLVAFTLFLDNILLTAIVPIMPHFLYMLEHPSDSSTESEDTDSTTIGNAINSTSASNETEIMNNDKTADVNSSSSDETDTSDERHDDLMQETFALGLLFASKPFVHLAATPVVGLMMTRVSGDRILFGSLLILFITTLIFALGNSYVVLFAARALQGFGSAMAGLSGPSIIAELYQNTCERGNAMAFSLSGIALGTLIGPTYGGVFYEFVGKAEPFLILALACLVAAGFQLYIRMPQVKKQKMEYQSILAVLTDPGILLACGAIGFANLGLSFLEPTLPIWMMDTMNAREWQQGAIFLPESICYLLCTYYIGSWGNRFGRWCTSMLGFMMLGVSYLALPLTSSFFEMFLPMMVMGFSIGLVDGAMVPELGNLADLRHSAVYGAVYALEEISLCLGNMIAPAFSGILMNSIGFQWSSVGIAILCFLYAPTMYLLRNPSTSEEKNKLLVT